MGDETVENPTDELPTFGVVPTEELVSEERREENDQEQDAELGKRNPQPFSNDVNQEVRTRKQKKLVQSTLESPKRSLAKEPETKVKSPTPKKASPVKAETQKKPTEKKSEAKPLDAQPPIKHLRSQEFALQSKITFAMLPLVGDMEDNLLERLKLEHTEERAEPQQFFNDDREGARRGLGHKYSSLTDLLEGKGKKDGEEEKDFAVKFEGCQLPKLRRKICRKMYQIILDDCKLEKKDAKVIVLNLEYRCNSVVDSVVFGEQAYLGFVKGVMSTIKSASKPKEHLDALLSLSVPEFQKTFKDLIRSIKKPTN